MPSMIDDLRKQIGIDHLPTTVLPVLMSPGKMQEAMTIRLRYILEVLDVFSGADRKHISWEIDRLAGGKTTSNGVDKTYFRDSLDLIAQEIVEEAIQKQNQSRSPEDVSEHLEDKEAVWCNIITEWERLLSEEIVDSLGAEYHNVCLDELKVELDGIYVSISDKFPILGFSSDPVQNQAYYEFIDKAKWSTLIEHYNKNWFTNHKPIMRSTSLTDHYDLRMQLTPDLAYLKDPYVTPSVKVSVSTRYPHDMAVEGRYG